MNTRKLGKIQEAIDAARKKSVTHGDLEAIATSLKRVRLKGAQSRGKEPAYVSTEFPNARPISIPDHGNAVIKRGTKKNILNDLEADVLRFRGRLKKDTQDSIILEGADYEN